VEAWAAQRLRRSATRTCARLAEASASAAARRTPACLAAPATSPVNASNPAGLNILGGPPYKPRP
jgi:hypothetical protein